MTKTKITRRTMKTRRMMVMGKMKMKMKVKDDDEYYYFYQHVDFSNQQFMKAMPRPAWRLDRDCGQANAQTSLLYPRYRDDR